jgi:Flp pilus assembly protein CpaB
MTYRARNILIAVALAVLAALLVGVYVTSYKHNVNQQHKTVKVLVAVEDIPIGTSGLEIRKNGMLAVREVARQTVVPGAFVRPSQLIGLVATQRILQGEQVIEGRFGPVAAAGIRSELTGNRRAIQIAGDQNQLLAGTLQAGDRVDVVASLKYKVRDTAAGSGGADVERVASRVALRGLEVLKTSGAAEGGAKLTAGSQDEWVILAVTDAQAQKLFFVVKNGDWSLQLRPVLHAADSPGSVETIESVLGDGLRPAQFAQLYVGRAVR